MWSMMGISRRLLLITQIRIDKQTCGTFNGKRKRALAVVRRGPQRQSAGHQLAVQDANSHYYTDIKTST